MDSSDPKTCISAKNRKSKLKKKMLMYKWKTQLGIKKKKWKFCRNNNKTINLNSQISNLEQESSRCPKWLHLMFDFGTCCWWVLISRMRYIGEKDRYTEFILLYGGKKWGKTDFVLRKLIFTLSPFGPKREMFHKVFHLTYFKLIGWVCRRIYFYILWVNME